MFDNLRVPLYKAALCNASALKTKHKTLPGTPAGRLRLKGLGLDRKQGFTLSSRIVKN